MSETNPSLESKYQCLQDVLRSIQSVAVAFSAGGDSTLLLKVALDVLGKENVIAVTGKSPSLPAAEYDQARSLVEELGVQHLVVETDEFDNEDYLANPPNRCYFCKVNLYDNISRAIQCHGFGTIISGANLDDHSDWRPGLKAGDEHGVRAPLAEAGLTKEDVRKLSKRLGLPTSDKPASPCLSSRIPYGERVTPEKLKMVEQAEAFLRQLGLSDCRVRHHDNLARIEIPADLIEHYMKPDLRRRIDQEFRRIGYAYVSMDLRGFRSGSLNEVLASGQRDE